MRKIFLFMMVSLDGFFEGEDHDLSWHNVDEEFNQFAIHQLKDEIGLLLFGHRTYELMASYWPTEEALADDPEVASLMNNIPKIVFSRTLDRVQETNEWKNITLMTEANVDEINQIKSESGKDIAIFGSNNLCVNLMKLGVVDEFRIMVAPVVIDKGTKLFKGLDKKMELKLTSSRQFENGNVLLTYQAK